MAVSLSQTERKVLNLCPNTAPAVLSGTQHSYHTGCCHRGSSRHCCPLKFLLKVPLREKLEDNIAVILRMKQSWKWFPLSPHRLEESLCVLSSFQVDLFLLEFDLLLISRRIADVNDLGMRFFLFGLIYLESCEQMQKVWFLWAYSGHRGSHSFPNKII